MSILNPKMETFPNNPLSETIKVEPDFYGEETSDQMYSINSGEDQCDEAFNNSGQLKTHEKTHTGEKPFACSKCDKVFTRKPSLKTHEMTHTGEKPFACSKCDKAFTESGNLERHEMTHTGEKPFACSQCDKAFKRVVN